MLAINLISYLATHGLLKVLCNTGICRRLSAALSYLPENCFHPYLFLVGHAMSVRTVCDCSPACPASTLFLLL